MSTSELSMPQEQLIAWGAALAVLVLALTTLWRAAKYFVTIAHEGGHALVAMLTGNRLKGITLHKGAAGATRPKGHPKGLKWFLMLVAGYIAPPLLGMGAAHLVVNDLVRPLLMLSLGLLVATLFHARNVTAVVMIVLTGALVFAVTWYATPQARDAFGYGVAWLLLVGGVRDVWGLQLHHIKGSGAGSDADQLAELTIMPVWFWVLMFYVVSVGSLYLGGRVLLVR